MNNIELKLTSKFAINQEVFTLSANGRRVEKGKISRINLGRVTVKQQNSNSPISFSSWETTYIVDNLSRKGDWNSLNGNQIYESYDEAVKARIKNNEIAFGRNKMDVRRSMEKLRREINRNDLSERDRKFYDKIAKLYGEEGF